jgi:glycosyltransferase involved in cell wall biosynthesis
MPRLIFVNRFFFPDHSATSQILSDLAFHLAGSGREVHVVTSRQIYDDPKAALPEEEMVEGVLVHRVASTRFGRTALVGRAVDYASFHRSIWRRLRSIARGGDLIVAKTDPPLTSIVAMAVARRTGARVVNWLQDIYPETAAELNVPFMRGPVGGSLAALRNRSLRDAEATVVVGDLMRQKTEAMGVRPALIHVIPNWCNDEDIRPVTPTDNPLRRKWHLDGKFVLGYSGNLGRAHEFETMLGAAAQLRNDPRFAFLIIGGGKRFDELARRAQECGVGAAFRFMTYQERAVLSSSLGAADAHWLSLNPKLEGLLVPSKFYGIAAAGRPVIVIGDADGELARLVRQHECGAVVAAGDSGALVDTLQHMADEPETVSAMGQNARKMLEARFSRRQGLARWGELLDRLDRAS